MEFDLSSAKEIEPQSSGGFDINSAKVIDDTESVYDAANDVVVQSSGSLNPNEFNLSTAMVVGNKEKSSFFGDIEIGNPLDTAQKYIGAILDGGLNLATLDAGSAEKRLEVINEKIADGETSDFRNWLFSSRGNEGLLKEKEKLDARIVEIAKLRKDLPVIKEGMGLGKQGEKMTIMGDIIGAGSQSLVQSMGLGMIMQSPKIAAMVFGAQAKSSGYQEARDAGFSVDKSNEMANVRAATAAAIEAIGLDTLMKVGGTVTKRIAKSALINSVEEGTQELYDIQITNQYDLTNIDFEEGAGKVFLSAFGGALVGGPVGFMSNSQVEKQARDTGLAEKEVARIDKFVKTLVEQNPDIKEQFNSEFSAVVDTEVGQFKYSPEDAQKALDIIERFETGQDIEITPEERNEISAIGERQIAEMRAEKGAQIFEDTKKIDSFKNQIDSTKEFIASPKGAQPMKKPLIDYMKKHGKVRAGSQLAKELAKMDINPRTQPALFKKDGKLGDMDNIPVSEFQEAFPNETIPDDGNGYVDRNFVLEKISQESFSTGPALSEQDASINSFIEELDRLGLDIDTVTPEQLFEAVERRSPTKEQVSELDNIEPMDIEQLIQNADPSFNKAVQEEVAQKQEEELVFDAPDEPSWMRRMADDIGTGSAEALVPISERIKRISYSLFNRLRRFEFDVKVSVIQDNMAVAPLISKMKNLPDNDYAALDIAMKNRDIKTVDAIAAHYGITEEIKAARQVFDNIYQRATNAGIEINYLDDLFPRRIKNLKGLMKAINKTEGTGSIIKEAIKAKEEILGRPLKEDEKATVVDTLLRGYRVEGVSLAKRGIFKERSIEQVTNALNKYYHTSEDAMLGYIYTANESIETNRFFGKKGNAGFAVDPAGSIGSLVAEMVDNDQIDDKQAQELKDMLNARFNPERMSEFMSTVRDAGYIATMGSPLNAITQFGDLSTSMYNAGLFNAGQTIIPAMLDKTRIKLSDLGFDDKMAQEFDNRNKTASIVNGVFKATGLNKMDRIGKLNLINSALLDAEKRAKNNDPKLMKKLELMFGKDAETVRQDLANGNITTNVKFYTFNTLLDFQPMALSEMPELYLRSKKGKMFYMLKSFTMKQINAYRRDVFFEIRDGLVSGDKKKVVQGMKNFVRLAGYFIIMGVSADWMKDFIKSFFGGEEMKEPEDYVIVNIFKAFGLNKYTFDQMAKPFGGSTPANAAFDFIKPPTKTLDNLFLDFKKIKEEGWKDLDDLKTIRSIPLGGELYYFWFGGGTEENKKTKKSEKPKKLGIFNE